MASNVVLADSIEDSIKYQTIEVRRQNTERGQICWIILNRPERLNAVSIQMKEDLNHVIDRLRDDTECRVVILVGNGRAFCAGADIGDGSIVTSVVEITAHSRFSNVVMKLQELSQPVIAGIQGAASGAGLIFALAADIRIGTPSFKVNTPFVLLGLSGAELGSSYLLPRIVGPALAAEMLYTGKFVYADQALQKGMINSIVPENELRTACLKFALDMLSCSREGLRMTKECLREGFNAPSLRYHVAMEDRNQVYCLNHPECRATGAAYFQKFAKSKL